MTELDKSVEIILSQSKQNNNPVSLFVLDGNLLIDSEEGLMFLPLIISPQISASLFDLGVLNFQILNSSYTSMTNDIEKFLFNLYQKTKKKQILNSDLHSQDFIIRPVIFPSKTVPPKIMKTSINWQEECAKKLNNKKTLIISLHQPGYLRHLGFFAKFAQSDIFGMEDSLQYCKQEWQNRQKFKGTDGKYHWLTVPIAHTGSYEPISAKRIVQDPRWQSHHWNVLVQRFGKYPYFEEISPFFKELYRRDWFNLRSLAEVTTRHIAIAMGLNHVNPIRTSALKIKHGKKGYAIVDFIRAILFPEFQHQYSSKHIFYLAGADSSYLTRKDGNGKTYADVILSSNIDIIYQKMLDNITLKEKGFTHASPAIEILFKEGLVGTRSLMHSIMRENAFD